MHLAVFCYNRPDKLRMCLELVDWSYVDKLWIFCDAAKGAADAEAVAETLKVAETCSFENKVVVAREKNYGTPKNVITGLDRVFKSADCCMILEDDCMVRPEAYAYIYKALRFFKNEKRVFSINTMAAFGPVLTRIASLFVRDDIIASRRVYAFWGWATWADRWKEFRQDLEPFRNPYGSAAATPINLGHHVGWTLRQYEQGRAGGWDARLMTLTYHQRRLHLHPRIGFMRNVGLDGTGIHIRARQDAVRSIAELGFSGHVPPLKMNNKSINGNNILALLSGIKIYIVYARISITNLLPPTLRFWIQRKLFRIKTGISRF